MAHEPGTPALAQVFGLAAAMKWFAKNHDWQEEQELQAYLRGKLSGIPGISIAGPGDNGIVSFSIAGYNSSDLNELLSEQGIAVRTGQHCTMPLLKKMQVSSLLRVSLGIYNDKSDVDRLMQALQKSMNVLGAP